MEPEFHIIHGRAPPLFHWGSSHHQWVVCLWHTWPEGFCSVAQATSSAHCSSNSSAASPYPSWPNFKWTLFHWQTRAHYLFPQFTGFTRRTLAEYHRTKGKFVSTVYLHTIKWTNQANKLYTTFPIMNWNQKKPSSVFPVLYKSMLTSYVTQGLHQWLGPQGFEPSFLHCIYSLEPKGVSR